MEDDVQKAYGASVSIKPLIEGLLIRGSYYYNYDIEQENDTSLVIQYKADGNEAYVQYLVSTKPGKGTGEGISAMLARQLIDVLQLVVRFDTWNPDTRVVDDETNSYMAGVNIKVKENLSIALNYDMTQAKVGGTGTPTTNLWMIQTKYSY